MKRICKAYMIILLLLCGGLVLEIGHAELVGQAAAVTMSIPTDVTGEPGYTVTVPVNVSDVTGEGVLSVWLAVTYDDGII